MLTRLHRRGWHYLLLGVLGWCLFFTNLGGPSLWDLDEGRNATCAMEMMEADNWVIPTFNGVLRVDKPALLYWLQIAAYHCFGVSEFSARLPSALAALATLWLCYELARSMFGRTTGLLAAVIAASTPLVCCGAARFANPDALLNFFIVLTLTLFWLGRERPWLGWFAAIGAAQGLGMLAKGPVAFVLPGAIMVLFLVWERRLALLFDRRVLVAAGVFALVALPWYVLVTIQTKGEFTRGFFLQHNLDRFVNPMENHSAGPWYYPLVIVVGTAPWSIFLGAAVWYGAWSALRQPWTRCRAWWVAAAEGSAAAEHIAAYRLLVCWAGLFLVFFTAAATKLPNYALPVTVPLAILIARFLDRWRRGALLVPSWSLPVSLASLVFIGVCFASAALVMSGVFSLEITRGRVFAGLLPLASLGILPILGALAGLWCLRRGRRAGFIASVAITGLLLLMPLGGHGMAALDSRKATRPLVAQVGALQRDQDIRIVAWQLEHLPSLDFYVQRTVQNCENAGQIATYLQYPLPVFVFLPASEWEQLRPTLQVPYRELARHSDMFHHDDVVVVANRPGEGS